MSFYMAKTTRKKSNDMQWRRTEVRHLCLGWSYCTRRWPLRKRVEPSTFNGSQQAGFVFVGSELGAVGEQPETVDSNNKKSGNVLAKEKDGDDGIFGGDEADGKKGTF